jgi:hypothetical protein
MITLRYRVEAALAEQLMADRRERQDVSTNGASSVPGDGCAVVIHLHRQTGGSSATVRASLLTKGGERLLMSIAAEIALTATERMLHIDAVTLPRACDGADRATGTSFLAASIDIETGRAVYLASALPKLLNLRGGTYDPPSLAIEW